MNDEQWKTLVRGITADIIAANPGLDVGSLPVTTMVVWYALRTPQEVTLKLQIDPAMQGDSSESAQRRVALLGDLALTRFALGQPCPMDGSRIFAMFLGDSTKIYTVASGDDGAVVGFLRFTLSDSGPHFAVESMGPATFQSEIAVEWEILAGVDEPEETETPAVNGGVGA
jgi:hypothetical protein